MRLNRVRRFGSIGVVVTLVLGALVALAPSASAAYPWICHGKAIERCVTVGYDAERGTYKGRARITDVAGGGDFRVWVRDVQLLYVTGPGDYEVVRSSADRDGSFDVKDVAATGAVNPCNWTDPTFRVRATFFWRGAADGHETYNPDAVNIGEFCD